MTRMADTPLIDPATFTELQDAAGADFVVELVAHLPRRGARHAGRAARRARAGDAEAFRRAAHSLKSNSNTFGATQLGRDGARPGAGRSGRPTRRPDDGAMEADALPDGAHDGRPEELGPWLSSAHGCWWSTTTRSTACCWPQPGAAGPPHGGGAENGRIALEMLRAEAFDLMLLDMEMPEMDGFGCWSS
jgi:hypothetical protein